MRKTVMMACVLVGVVACSDKVVTAPEKHEPIPAPGVLYPLTLETFDGSGEAVHPDPVETPAGWGSAQTYLVATPYPGGNATYENPSYYEGFSPADWHPPEGGVNPVATPGSGAYLSDPDQVYNPETNQIWLYYRRVTVNNEIWLIRSGDGVHWDAPVKVLSVPNHQAVSPTVVRRASGDWMMWSVNSGAEGCSASGTLVELRRSTDGMHWSAPDTVIMPKAADRESPWHMDVTWVPERKEFWAVFNAKGPGMCTTKVLRLARSTNGVVWTAFPAPLLESGVIPDFADVVYRASLLYNAASDRVTLWYSGARLKENSGTYAWHVAMQEMSRETMFGIASGVVKQTFGDRVGVMADMKVRARRRVVPLTNETAP